MPRLMEAFPWQALRQVLDLRSQVSEWPSPFGWVRRSRSNAGSVLSNATTAMDEDTEAAADMSGSCRGSPSRLAGNANNADSPEIRLAAPQHSDARARLTYTCAYSWRATYFMSPQQTGFGACWMRAGIALVRSGLVCHIAGAGASCKAIFHLWRRLLFCA